MGSSHIFCFSLDFELGVGAEHSSRRSKVDSPSARLMIRRLLDICTRYDVTATFGVIGHLMLRGCRGHDASKAPRNDWWDNDPCTTVEENDAWYAPDIVQEIAERGHEVACHTFSHVDFSDVACTEPVARFEIEQWLRAALGLGIRSKSLVFPKNRPGHLKLLPEYGFDRFTSQEQPGKRSSLKPMLPAPTLVSGNDLLSIPRTQYFGGGGLNRIRKIAELQRMLLVWRRKGGFLHLWTHEWTLVGRGDIQLLAHALRFASKVGTSIQLGQLEHGTTSAEG